MKLPRIKRRVKDLSVEILRGLSVEVVLADLKIGQYKDYLPLHREMRSANYSKPNTATVLPVPKYTLPFATIGVMKCPPTLENESRLPAVLES
jgi:hypothetical protein